MAIYTMEYVGKIRQHVPWDGRTPSQGQAVRKHAGQGSNLRPAVLETAVLPVELPTHVPCGARITPSRMFLRTIVPRMGRTCNLACRHDGAAMV